MSDSVQQVIVRTPLDLYNALKRHAEEEDRTMAAAIRRALSGYLDSSDSMSRTA